MKVSDSQRTTEDRARVTARPRCLVVAAHPDDETLGCGATMNVLSQTMDAYVVVLGEGLTSRKRSEAERRRVTLNGLKSSCRAAVGILGGKRVDFFDFPDNRFDTVPLLDIIQRLEAVIKEIRPERVYTHHPGDLNIDHRIAFQAVLTATRPVRSCCVRELYTFEVPSSTEWAFQQFRPEFKPNVFVDVSATIETKVKAMSQYESESRSFPHPRSPEALRTMAQRWGTVVGREYVEAFEMVRSIR